jgi:hypothetical protein
MAFDPTDTWAVTPVNGDDFTIFAIHVHPVSQIQAGLATLAALTTHDGKLDVVDGIADAILVDTGTTLPATLATIQAKTDNLPDGIVKNTALAAFPFFMVDSADKVTGKTGETVTAQRSIDGAAFGACANAVAEIGNGIYKIDLDASDLNGDTIVFQFTSANALARVITVVTQS